MALLDKLKDKALAEISDKEKQAEWVSKGFDSSLAQARALMPKGDDSETKRTLQTAEFAFVKIEKHKAALVDLGAHGLRSTFTLMGIGQYDEAAKHAALLKLSTSASWDEVNTAILSTAAAGNQAKRDLDAEIEAFKDMLKDIGITAARAVLPFLLAVI